MIICGSVCSFWKASLIQRKKIWIKPSLFFFSPNLCGNTDIFPPKKQVVKKTRTVEESVTVLKRAIHLLGSTIIIISPGVFNLQVLGLPASQAGYESRTPHWHIATPWYNVRRLDHLHLVFNSPPRDFMELKKKKKRLKWTRSVCV